MYAAAVEAKVLPAVPSAFLLALAKRTAMALVTAVEDPHPTQKSPSVPAPERKRGPAAPDDKEAQAALDLDRELASNYTEIMDSLLCSPVSRVFKAHMQAEALLPHDGLRRLVPETKIVSPIPNSHVCVALLPEDTASRVGGATLQIVVLTHEVDTSKIDRKSVFSDILRQLDASPMRGCVPLVMITVMGPIPVGALQQRQA
jgi:hypothetical protein